MRKFLFYILLISVAVSCTEPIISTFGSIGGTVQDGETSEFLSGVKVTINPLGYSQVTNSDGAFQYDNLDVAEYTLIYEKTGYETYKHKVTVKPGVVSPVQVTLNPADASLTITPSVLDFVTKESQMQLKISTTASGTSVSYGLTVSNDWISLSKTSGMVSDTDYVTVVVSRAGLSPASYDGNIFVHLEGKELSVPVKMIVAAAGAPVVTMETVSEVTSSSAIVSGTLKSLGDSKVSQLGFCWSAENPSPGLSDEFNQLGDAADVKSFSAKLSDLKSSTKYYVRAYAVNTYGTSYSDHVETFTTSASGGGGNDGGGDDSDKLAVPQGLVSYYTFDSSDASDATENELDGILVNTPSFVDATVDGTGKALHLNGTKGQYMSIPYNVFKKLDKYSISFWIKDFSVGVIFSGITSDYVRSDYPRLLATTDETFRFYTGYDNYNTTPAFVYQYTPIQSQQWHHIAITVNDNVRSLYVDGTKVDANEAYVGGGNGYDASKIFIGGNNDGKYDLDCSTMKIDNIRFYQRSLTNSEIKEIYTSEK